MKKIFLYSFILIFTACGSSSTGGTPLTQAETITAIFLDDLVQGLEYTCSSGTFGITNVRGEYTCNRNDTVTFKIDTLTIGSVIANKAITTPYSLFPNNLKAALNLARLLQTLNSNSSATVITLDSNSSSKIITLDPKLVVKLRQSTNFTSATFVNDAQTDLHKNLVGEVSAYTALNSNIIATGGTLPKIALTGANSVNGDTNSPIFLGDGNNSITINGTVEYGIFTGKGDDALAIAGDINAAVDLGNGDNSITVGGDIGHEVITGDGKDTIKIGGDLTAPLHLGAGDDTLYVAGNIKHEASMGDGDDTVEIGGDITATLKLDGGDDFLHIGGNVSHLLQAGEGNDRVIIDGSVTATIELGDGNNYLIVGGKISHEINAGNGVNSVELLGYPYSDWLENKDNFQKFFLGFSNFKFSDGVIIGNI